MPKWHSEVLSLVEEIGSRVWYALVENDGRLLREYNHRRGTSLLTHR
jgi:hypothetical protein